MPVPGEVARRYRSKPGFFGKHAELPPGMSEKTLRILHHRATRPTVEHMEKGAWHMVQGYPSIVATIRPNGKAAETAHWGQRVFGMSPKGELYQMRKGWKLGDRHLPEPLKGNGGRPERLQFVMGPKDIMGVLGEPQYEKNLTPTLKGTYERLLSAAIEETGLPTKSLTEEQRAKLTPSSLHTRVLQAEENRIAAGKQPDPELLRRDVIANAVHDAMKEIQPSQ